MLWKLKAGFRPRTFKQTQEISSVKPTNQERDLLNTIFRKTIKKNDDDERKKQLLLNCFWNRHKNHF